MKEKADLKLKLNVKMDERTAEEVIKIACALKALSLHTSLMLEREDCPEELTRMVDAGTAAIEKLFDMQ
jgi:hypothetical protein